MSSSSPRTQPPPCDWAQHRADNTPPFGLAGCAGEARVVECHDGDTMKVALHVPWAANGVVRKVTLRLQGVNTPEVVGPSKLQGKAAHDVVMRWLAPHFVDGTDVKAFLAANVVLVRVECFDADKYGRTLARVYSTAGCLDTDDGCLNDYLLARGFRY